uniref:Uncharacterized protein n=1 Tax=Arundo donax TaxID=35708 RepID=A0A0A9BU51_ARUDO
MEEMARASSPFPAASSPWRPRGAPHTAPSGRRAGRAAAPGLRAGIHGCFRCASAALPHARATFLRRRQCRTRPWPRSNARRRSSGVVLRGGAAAAPRRHGGARAARALHPRRPLAFLDEPFRFVLLPCREQSAPDLSCWDGWLRRSSSLWICFAVS